MTTRVDEPSLNRFEPASSEPGPRWSRACPLHRLICPNNHYVPRSGRSNEFLTLPCPKCHVLIAVWTLRDERAFVAEVKGWEDRFIEQERLTPVQVLEFLGFWPASID